jgi:hypothetical protein
MNTTNDNGLQELGMFTPAMLAKQRMTLTDMPQGVYDHKTQTRTFPSGEKVLMLPDTQFDGETS